MKRSYIFEDCSSIVQIIGGGAVRYNGTITSQFRPEITPGEVIGNYPYFINRRDFDNIATEALGQICESVEGPGLLVASWGPRVNVLASGIFRGGSQWGMSVLLSLTVVLASQRWMQNYLSGGHQLCLVLLMELSCWGLFCLMTLLLTG